MKLINELDHVTKAFEQNKYSILKHKESIIQHGNYSDLNVRLSWDCLRAFLGTAYVNNLYNDYNANDNHVTTLGIRALKNLDLI